MHTHLCTRMKHEQTISNRILRFHSSPFSASIERTNFLTEAFHIWWKKKTTTTMSSKNRLWWWAKRNAISFFDFASFAFSFAWLYHRIATATHQKEEERETFLIDDRKLAEEYHLLWKKSGGHVVSRVMMLRRTVNDSGLLWSMRSTIEDQVAVEMAHLLSVGVGEKVILTNYILLKCRMSLKMLFFRFFFLLPRFSSFNCRKIYLLTLCTARSLALCVSNLAAIVAGLRRICTLCFLGSSELRHHQMMIWQSPSLHRTNVYCKKENEINRNNTAQHSA